MTENEDPISEREQSLLAKLRAGDAQALADYIEHCRPRLCAFLHRQLGEHLRAKTEVDDLFQDTALEALRQFPTADFSQREPFSWLCGIGERKIIDTYRKNFETQKRDAGRERSLDAPAGPSGGDEAGGGLIGLLIASMTSASQAFSREAREYRLLNAIAQLPEEQQNALRWRYIENLPSKEIADRLGKSDVSVRVMLTRSLKRLQELLGEF